MIFACEKFGVVLLTLREDGPGNERHRFGLN
jgi:hypothetical protein